MRNSNLFPIDSPQLFKSKALKWCSHYFETYCFLDSNSNKAYGTSKFEALIAVGNKKQLIANAGENAFDRLQTFVEPDNDWFFGYLGYDLKNELENISSNNTDYLGFPDLYFFQPEIVIEIQAKQTIIHTDSYSLQNIFDQIDSQPTLSEPVVLDVNWESRLSKSDYLSQISQIKQHIQAGDIYELNFCQEFYAENVSIEPNALFEKFNQYGKSPFSGFLRFEDHYLLSSSPERFLSKSDNLLRSQPIKGTAKRSKDFLKDSVLLNNLQRDSKEKAENVMIVDLVRNDLSRSCLPGTVKVEELYGIKSFEQVHQMVSTIIGELKPDVHFIDAIKQAFPMGSMTGAPKVAAMKLIEKYELTKRGVYSGALGYISPNKDFDFNVIIRSLLFNQLSGYLSYHAGSAITDGSIPEKEFEECLLKAKAISQLFDTSKELTPV